MMNGNIHNVDKLMLKKDMWVSSRRKVGSLGDLGLFSGTNTTPR